MIDAELIRATGAIRMSHAGTGSQQLDRIQAQLAHLQATLQRVLVLLERVAGKPPAWQQTEQPQSPDATRG